MNSDNTTFDNYIGEINPAKKKYNYEKLSLFLQKLKSIIGESKVITDLKDIKLFSKNEIASNRIVSVVIRPKTNEDIICIVKIANKYKIKIYPVSTGNNWGYGGGSPVLNNSVIIDLSHMDKIVSFDDELGIVTVQPGVTQNTLFKYIKKHNLKYLVPVTGAGPDCSLIGNAIEKGYGITPNADHFGAVTSLEAILPDGSTYRSAFSENKCEITDKIFKWGIGPYLDGIFAQGNFGIITEITIALAPVQESVEGFLISIKSDNKLEEAVALIQNLLKVYGNLMGSVNLMNNRRVMSMLIKYPKDKIVNSLVMSDEIIEDICQKNQISDWTVGGMIYGNKKIIKEVKKIIRQNFKPISRRIVFFNRKKINFLQKLLSIVPSNFFVNIKNQLTKLSEAFKCAEGIPTEAALPLCYWKSGTRPPKGQPMNPAADNCGVLWYSPLVPMKPNKVREYVDMVKKECLANNIEPLITLTSLSYRCFDSTVPILFDPSNSDEINNTRQCYDSLFDKGRAKQFHPYRVGIDHMNKIINKDSTYWKMVQSLKNILDPNNILAPGRYNMADQKGEV